VDDGDTEFVPPAEHEDDDEETLEQEEKAGEGEEANKNELDELAADADIPIEQLLAQYGMKLPPIQGGSATHLERKDSEDLNSPPEASSPREIESDGEPDQPETTAAQSEVAKENEGGEVASLPPATSSSVPTPPATSEQPPSNDAEGALDISEFSLLFFLFLLLNTSLW